MRSQSTGEVKVTVALMIFLARVCKVRKLICTRGKRKGVSLIAHFVAIVFGVYTQSLSEAKGYSHAE